MREAGRERIAVVGVSSQIGPPLVRALCGAGYAVAGISRSADTEAPCTVHVYAARCRAFDPPLEDAKAIISLAPLPNIADVLDMARALRADRVVAFGSTGTFSKAGSTSALERQFVRDQLAAEALLAEDAKRSGIHWTLFRPTMIYGANADQNVTFIRSVIRRFRIFPIPIGAAGLRQPVHVDDLAAACVAVLDAPATFDRAYNLGGGERLPYPELVRRISRAAGHPPLLLPMPGFVYRRLIALGSLLPGLDYLRAEMADRMFVDLIADNADAERDFAYAPRGFEPGHRA